MILWAFACATPELVATNPLLAMERNIDRTPVEVHVTEVLPAGGYIYVRTDETPPRWIASINKPISVGSTVTVRAFGTVKSFRSGRLDRTFDVLTFAVLDL